MWSRSKLAKAPQPQLPHLGTDNDDDVYLKETVWLSKGIKENSCIHSFNKYLCGLGCALGTALGAEGELMKKDQHLNFTQLQVYWKGKTFNTDTSPFFSLYRYTSKKAHLQIILIFQTSCLWSLDVCLFVCFSFIKEYTSGFLWWANPSSIIWFKQIFSGSRLLHEVSKAPLTVWHVLCLLGVALSQCRWRVSRALRGPGGIKMSWQRVTNAIMQSRSGSLLILPCAAQEEREKYPLPL